MASKPDDSLRLIRDSQSILQSSVKAKMRKNVFFLFKS